MHIVLSLKFPRFDGRESAELQERNCKHAPAIEAGATWATELKIVLWNAAVPLANFDLLAV